MKKETSIKVKNVSKKYVLGSKKDGSLRGTFSNLFKKSNKIDKQEFMALDDVSFEIKEGTALGIIGANGAGKSTLLKVLSRITEPSNGRIEITGRVASLLEVGTGFHPELTGRENIFLNGTILGMSRKEVKSKFDEIVEFSGVGKFIDSPVKHYSSGMYVRLAFAVAAHLEPEILIIDEVLAVGDAEFQRKCLGKMKDVSQNKGRTVIFVSHDMGAIKQLCSEAILLENGKIAKHGTVQECIGHYTTTFNSISESKGKTHIGNGSILINSVKLLDEENNETTFSTAGGTLKFLVDYACITKVESVIFKIEIFNALTNSIVFVCNNFHSSKPFSSLKKSGKVMCEIPNLPLNSGQFYINIQCLNNFEIAYETNNYMNFEVFKGDFFGTGNLPNPSKGLLVNHNWQEIESDE